MSPMEKSLKFMNDSWPGTRKTIFPMKNLPGPMVSSAQVVSWIRGKLVRNLKITCQHVGKTRFYSIFKLTCGKKWKKWFHRAIIPFPSMFFFLGVVPLSFGEKKHLFFPVPLGGKMNIPGLGLVTWLVAGGKKTG